MQSEDWQWLCHRIRESGIWWGRPNVRALQRHSVYREKVLALFLVLYGTRRRGGAMLKAYRYKLEPNKSQRYALARTLDV